MHPPGCIDVHSERAAVDLGHPEVHEGEQFRREAARFLHGGRELLGRPEDRRTMSLDLGGVEDESEELAVALVDVLQDRIVARFLDLSHAWHGAIISPGRGRPGMLERDARWPCRAGRRLTGGAGARRAASARSKAAIRG